MVFLWIGIPIFWGVRLSLPTGFLSLVVLAIIVAVLVPNSVRQELLDSARTAYEKLPFTLVVDAQWVGESGWNKLEYLGEFAAKGIHFSLFFAASIAAWFAWPMGNSTTQLVYLLLFAAVTEVLQFFAIGREPEFGDWLVDASGVLLAFALLGFFSRQRTSAET